MRPSPLNLILAGALAFLLTLIVCLPARVIGFFLPATIAVGNLQGTVWNGSTDLIAIGNVPYGALQWKLHPLHLFRGRLAFDGHLSSSNRDLSGLFAFGFGHSIQAWNLELRCPLNALPFNAVPGGWDGDVRATLRELGVKDGKVQTVLGAIDARNLHKPPPDNLQIGDYRLTFDEHSRQGQNLVGQLQDLEGPMQVSGTVAFLPNHSIKVDGMMAPRANTPQAMLDSLRFLGPPDAQGRRPFGTEVGY